MSLVIGKIVKAQGIKGEVKVVPITDDALRFNKLKKANVGEDSYDVEYARVDNSDLVYLKFSGVDTRNDAELLVNRFISVARADAVALPSDRYFIVDVIGCAVSVEGKPLGTLVDVLQNAKVDVYVVSDGKREIMFPALKDLILSVDIDKKKIDLSKKRFEEVAVYE